MRRALWAAGLLSSALVLVACGEKPQTATARKGDVSPSQGAMAAYTAEGWKPGDATSWETQMKRRAEQQNEYARTQPN